MVHTLMIPYRTADVRGVKKALAVNVTARERLKCSTYVENELVLGSNFYLIRVLTLCRLKPKAHNK